MTISQDLDHQDDASTSSTSISRSYWDPYSKCRIVATTPRSEPGLWKEFLKGAKNAYTKFGVLEALEYEAIREGSTTSIFFVALDRAGNVVAGVRAQGPYSSATDTHADLEWQNHPHGRAQLRRMIEERIPDGVLEIKSGWVAEDVQPSKHLAYMVGQAPLFSASILGARYSLATAASHVLKAWATTGAVVAEHVDPIPYPSDRYLTRVIWWDRHTNALNAHAEQQKRIDFATLALLEQTGPFSVKAA